MDGQTLDYDESYLFKIEPTEVAEGYLWGFFQNGEMVWENLRDEGELSGVEYSILPANEAHNKIQRSELQVMVRAAIAGGWSEPLSITITLR